MQLSHLTDNSESNTRADCQNASDALSLSDFLEGEKFSND